MNAEDHVDPGGAAGRRHVRREPGQIFILFALFLVALLLLVGGAIDMADAIAEDARMQNALDAASLAGSQALSGALDKPAATAVAIAQATATEYLALNGYTDGGNTSVTFAFPTSTPRPASTPSSVREHVQINLQKTKPTYFWPLIGVDSLTMRGSASARAARGMTDVMLSLDVTGSMDVTGNIPPLRDAVEAFANQVEMNASDAGGTKVGLARFAGVKCLWDRNSPLPGDNDNTLDLSANASTNEYVGPCEKDMTLLQGLTLDPAPLKKLAKNSPASGTCPNSIPTSMACPLQHWEYAAVRVAGQGTGAPGGGAPTYTGTRIANGIDVVATPYAWSTVNGGRNASVSDPSGSVWARKVLVLMTDGQNEAYPDPGLPASAGVSQWDNELRTAAAALKPGPNASITEDDVEIFVVGYFCTPYSSSTTAIPGKWCKSQIAAQSQALRACPGPTWPPAGVTPSAIDNLLVEASSSTPGTCDHYFPLQKTEDLPSLFAQLASRISRGRLTQ